MRQFTTFYVGETFFGIDILQVKEINNMLRYTPVPDSPDYIKGLLNLRGQIITIFDLAKRIGRDENTMTNKTRNLILKADGETLAMREQGLLKSNIGMDAVGFIVDKIGDVIEVNEENIEEAPANTGDVAKELIEGVVELDNDILILLNIAELVDYQIENQ